MTDISVILPVNYDISLVVLSILIAIIASYTALVLAGRVTVAQGKAQKLWLAGGAIAMGVGIWSMHFVAMLAYKLPIPVVYEIKTVLVSMLVATFAAAVALFTLTCQERETLILLAAGLCMGMGMAAMHFIGMAAMQLEAIAQYDFKLVILSIVIAIGASLIALQLAFFNLNSETTVIGGVRKKIGSAIVMGIAIVGMHYTAMAAVSFQPSHKFAVQVFDTMNNSLLGIGISLATLFVLALAVVACLIDQRLSLALNQQREFLHNVIETNPNCIFVKDRDGKYILANQAAADVFGTTIANLIGKTDADINSNSEEVKQLFCTDREVMTALQQKLVLEETITDSTGKVHWFQTVKKPLFSPDGKAHQVLGVATDITERKQVEKALRESEERYRRIIETAAEGIWIIDAESKTSFVNTKMAEMLGYSIEEMLDVSMFEFIDIEDQAIAAINVKRRRQGIKEQHDFKFRRKDGSELWAIVSTNPIFDANGEYAGALGMITDITERKRIEEERGQLLAREQEARAAAEIAQQRFLSIVQGLDAIVTEVNPTTWQFSFVNQRAEDILGYPVERWLAEPDFWINLVHPDDLEHAAALCQISTAQGRDHKFEYRAIAADGRVVWLRDFVRVFLDGDGSPQQLLGLMVDITDQKQTEQALQKAHEELELKVEQRTIELRKANEQLQIQIAERQQAEAELLEISIALENALEGISRLDAQGRYVAVNRAYASLLGYQPEEMIGMAWQNIIYPKDLPNLKAAYQEMLVAGKVEAEARAVRQDGSIIYRQVTMIGAYDQQQQFIGHYCFAKDITERKQTEQALRESEDRFRQLVQDLHVGVLLLGPNAQVQLCNPAAQDFLGLTESQLLGKTCYDPDWQVVREDLLPFPKQELPVPQAIATCQPVRDVVMGVRHPAKSDYTWLFVNAEPQFASDGSIKQVICSLNNISERKRAEEEIKKLNIDLQHRAVELEAANKELEAFSYSVSHDLRAPLRALNGFSRILLNEYASQLTSEPKRYLQMLSNNAQQMSELIDDLLTFSRLSRSPLKKQLVNTEEIVRQALANLFYEQENRNVEVTLSHLPACLADSALLKQVWINLLANAIKFTRQQDIAQIEVGYQQIHDEVIYFVKDNGVGFDMQYADKLFGVFQRLHRAEEYDGTGVGLAIVQRIVHRHGGRVWAEAAVNQGATFYFTLGGGYRPQ